MKLTVNKTVFWDAGEKKMSGKVKQIMGDYVVIKGSDANYIVNKKALNIKPISKLASLFVLAGIQDKHKDSLEFEIDLKTGEFKLTWLDTWDANGNMKGCSTDASDPVINQIDSIFTAGMTGVKKAWNSKPPPPGGSSVKKDDKNPNQTTTTTVKVPDVKAPPMRQGLPGGM